jgi:hypothetical protein
MKATTPIHLLETMFHFYFFLAPISLRDPRAQQHAPFTPLLFRPNLTQGKKHMKITRQISTN